MTIKKIAIIMLSVTVLLTNATVIKAAVSTPPNFKVAFIGDTADGNNFQSVLNLIKSEGAQMTIHEGDFSYAGLSPWNSMINNTLGSSYPYYGANGNHDSWSTYWPFFQGHITGSGATVLDNASGSDKEYALKYQGITMVFVGDGGSGSWSGYAGFVNNQLSSSDSVWKICNWHRTGVKNNTTSPSGRSMTSAGEKPEEMGVQVYEACRNQGAIVAQAHEHSYSRTKTVTKFDPISTSGSGGIVTNNSLSADTIQVKPGSTFVFTSGLGGHSGRDFNCDHHNNDNWWASIYTLNHYMKSGTTQKKNCTVTGSGTYGNKYDNNIYPAGGINKYTYGALFITFNVDGDPKKARGYFKNIDGQIVDQFTIFADSSVPVSTPTPTIPSGNTPTPGSCSKQGDANCDGKIDGFDYVTWWQNFNTSRTGPSFGDFNNSGFVDGFDYVIWWQNFGT